MRSINIAGKTIGGSLQSASSSPFPATPSLSSLAPALRPEGSREGLLPPEATGALCATGSLSASAPSPHSIPLSPRPGTPGRGQGEGPSACAARCFVIAEAGVNHNGDVPTALRLIDAAADAGADAVKFQTFEAERLASPTAPKAEYQQRTTDPAESQLEMIRKLELPIDAYPKLIAHCRSRNIVFLSTPFDEQSADLLERLDIPAFKIPSGEITNWPFLQHVARKGRPIILSTGMSHLREVDDAVQIIRRAGCRDLALLHCVSNYPAAPADVNLRAMQTMADAFDLPVGYSDHTTGLEIAIAAVALGASIIEKHFTLDRKQPGPDHKASLEPPELAAMVKAIRAVESALGHGRKEPASSEANTAAVARKSLAASRDLPAGTVLTRHMLIALRPGTGIPPSKLPEVVGRRIKSAIPAGTLIAPENLA